MNIVYSLRGMRIGKRITLMTVINVLAAALLLGLAWFGLQRVEERLREMQSLRDQNIRMEAIGKKGLRLLLLARQYMDEGKDNTVTQVAIFGADLERSILAEAKLDPSIAPRIDHLLRALKGFQQGFDELYFTKKDLATAYEELLEQGENISSYISIVSANARGEGAYNLLPELEKSLTWLHQAIASVNRFYFSGEQFQDALNGIATLDAYLPALADHAGNNLRASYLEQAAQLVGLYGEGVSRLAQLKAKEKEQALKGLNEPQARLQAAINDILQFNIKREQQGATAFREELERLTITGLSLVAGLVLLSGLLSWAIGHSITAPLGTLHQAILDQAEGRPVDHIPAGEEGDELAAMAGTLRKVIALQAEKDALIGQVNEALGRIRDLLDNSGQGVLSFGEDLLVEAEYSRESLSLFGKDEIAGCRVDALLVPDDVAGQELLAQNLRRLCRQKDLFRRDMLLSLMPSEFTIRDKTVEVQYRPLQETDNASGERLMLLLTDVSGERKLQETVQAEGRRLSLVVAAVKNRGELLDVMDDLRGFLDEVKAHWSSENPVASEAELHKIARLLHTYKGLFSLLECINLPQALHEAESRIAALPPTPDGKTLLAALDNEALKQAATEDLEVIRQALGPGFLEKRGEVVLPEEKTASLHALGEALLQHFGKGHATREIEQGINLLRQLRYVDLRQMLERYPRMAVQLAERQEKQLAPFSIAGPELLVDPVVFAPFARSLVHIFRNAVDHGLESPEEREKAGKPIAGAIRCEVSPAKDGGVNLTIQDDGRGLDHEALAAKALEFGLNADQDPSLLIFIHGLSTSAPCEVYNGMDSPQHGADVPLSGRGVGLAAVKAELNRLRGVVAVNSEPGRGTCFDFHIPPQDASMNTAVEPSKGAAHGTAG